MNRIILICLTAVAIAFAGCDQSTSSGGGKPKLVYIPKSAGNQYFVPLIDGIKKAAEENGMDFVTVTPDTADSTSQLPLIKDQIQQGVAAIVISPNSPDALNPVFQEAMGKGIHVVTVDSDLTGNEQFRTAGVLTVDPQTVGESQVELMGSLIDYKGKIAILSATTDAPNQNRWIEIMKATLTGNPKYKEMQLVEIVYGNDEPKKSRTEAEALMTKYPDLRGIIAPTTVGVNNAAAAVEAAKKADQVKVTGLGLPNEMRAYVKNGTVKAFALWSPYDEGYLAGCVAAQLVKGTLKPAPGVKFTAGTLGERQIREKNVIITGPPVTFTADNIDKFNF